MSCHKLIKNSEIEEIYQKSGIKEIIIEKSKCLEDDNIKYVIIKELNIKKGENILSQNLKRTYYKERKLISFSGIGKVAKHDIFVLKTKYRGKKIGSIFHKNELEIYKKNNFVEIHLDAAFSGIFVWPKMNFVCNDRKDESRIFSIWINFFLNTYDEISLNKKYEIISKYSKITEIPSKYTQDFTPWYNRYKKLVIPMHKRIHNGE